MRKTFNFGKIAVCGEQTYKRADNGEMIPTGETTPKYYEFTASGSVWNARHTDIIMGGQCLDSIVKAAPNLLRNKTFNKLYYLWSNYHLNGMNAGTPEQQEAIKEWENAGNKYEYTAVCEMLKARNLYEVNYTGLAVGKEYKNEPYKYGHGWIINELPPEVIKEIQEVLTND